MSIGHHDMTDREWRLIEPLLFDTVLDDDVILLVRAPSPVTMEDLDWMIGPPDLRPLGTNTQPLAHQEYGLLASGLNEHL